MKPRFKWRHQYDTDADEKEGDAAALICADESLTQQHFTEDADLNVIAKRFGINAIPVGPIDPSHFRDTTQDPELAEILQHRIDAKNHFMGLPAKLRQRFHNSPSELWDFVNDPDNAEEAIRLGILKETTPETAASAPASTPGASATTAPATSATAPTGSPPPTPPKGV